MATTVKKWWLREELVKFIPDFDEKATAHLASLPVKPRPVSEITRLRQELAALKGETPTPATEPPAAPVVGAQPAR